MTKPLVEPVKPRINVEEEIEKHFYEHVLQYNREKVFAEDIVTSIAPCYDLSEIQSLKRMR